jgi:hypothetical protein
MLSQYLSLLLVADLPLDCVATAPSISDTIRVHAALHPAIVSTDLPTTTFSELDCTARQIGDELKAAGSQRRRGPASCCRKTCVTTFAGFVANELQGIFTGPEFRAPNAIAPHADFL